MADVPAPSRVSGVPPSEETLQWQAAAAELSSDKSLARLTEGSKLFAATLVTLLGSVLSGLGLAATGRIDDAALRWIAGAVVGLSSISAVLALSMLVPSVEQLHPGNLDEVAAWYRRRLQRAARLQLSAFLLILAILLAGAGTVLRLMPEAPSSLLSMRVVNAAEVKLAVKVDVMNLSAGDRVETKVIGRRQASGELVVFHDVSVADESGKLSIAGDIGEVKGVDAFVLEVTVPARDRTWSSSLQL